MNMERLGRWGGCAALVIVLSAAALLVFAQLNRPIEQMRIEGQLSTAERALIRDALAHYGDANILTTSLDAVVADINALGWPQKVSARRVWPDTLVLRINRQDVVAVWNDTAFLTNNAKVIEDADVVVQLPVIEAQGLDPEVALGALQQLDELARLQGLRVVALRHSFAEGWWLKQSDGVAVSLGRSDEALRQRYLRFMKVRAELPLEQLAALEYADVRYANGVALGLGDAASELLVGNTQ
ncbi:MAG: cell division protein FtsQ/DivIB [Pseudomonadales bacterium]